MLKHYISIARPSHWFKNVFMLPGAFMAWLTANTPRWYVAFLWLGLTLLATCLISSANYTINELLDARDDRRHPDKQNRPAVQGHISNTGAWIQWLVLASAGLALVWPISRILFAVEVLFLVMGLLYNLPPIRLKDQPFLDVLSESVNNPIRFVLGWYGIGCVLIPPVSLIFAYWMLGAFFMAIKRFAELRHINDAETAASYRKSFSYYTEERLFISIIFYATAAALLGGIFLMRYRMELILSVPFIAGFMAYYMRLGFLTDSPVQHPESLYRQTKFVVYAFLTTAVIVLCMVVHMPWVDKVFQTTVPGGF